MAKNPSFSFYTSDFLTETTFLSFEDKGKLITLFCLQHQLGHLSKEQIQKVCGDLSTEVMNFFQLDAEGKYFCEKIDVAKEKRDKFVQKQRENGAKKWNKNKFGNNLASAKVMPNKKFGKGLAMPFENEIEIENEKEIEVEIEKTEKGNKVVRKKGKTFIKPTKEEVLEFAKAEQLRTDIVDKWFNHYESNGWKVGQNSMKNWKASYRNWCSSDYNQPKNKGNPFLDMLRKEYPEEVGNIFPDAVDVKGEEQ
jgi:hypothetical protein